MISILSYTCCFLGKPKSIRTAALPDYCRIKPKIKSSGLYLQVQGLVFRSMIKQHLADIQQKGKLPFFANCRKRVEIRFGFPSTAWKKLVTAGDP